MSIINAFEKTFAVRPFERSEKGRTYMRAEPTFISALCEAGLFVEQPDCTKGAM